MSEQDMMKRISDLEARKKALRDELTRMETHVNATFEDVKEDVAARVSPMYWIKTYPLHAVAIAAALGFMAATGGRTRSRSSFLATLFSELKVVAARKAVQAIVKSIDKKG